MSQLPPSLGGQRRVLVRREEGPASQVPLVPLSPLQSRLWLFSPTSQTAGGGGSEGSPRARPRKGGVAHPSKGLELGPLPNPGGGKGGAPLKRPEGDRDARPGWRAPEWGLGVVSRQAGSGWVFESRPPGQENLQG